MAIKEIEATQAQVLNGVNVSDLFQTSLAVKEDPTLGKFHFQLTNEWLNGGHNRSIINEYRGAGQKIERPQSFLLDADEPPVLLGQDKAANPAEYLLTALAACVTTSLVYHASARGITIDEIESTVEGDIDLQGFLGLNKNVRNGFQNIRMELNIRANVTDEQFQEVAELGPRFSPIFDSIKNSVPINFKAKRMSPKEISVVA